MIFVVDFDGTFTAAPELFAKFIRDAQVMGHRAVIATGRANTEDNVAQVADYLHAHDLAVPVYFCGSRPKKKVLLEQGLPVVDVWLDDNPAMVDLGYEGLTRFGENVGGSRG